MEPTSEAERIKQTELHWNKAIENNLVEEMSRYMDDDWIIFSGDGNLTTKQMFLASVEKGELVHTKMDFEVLRVKVYKDTGLLMQRGTSAGIWQGKSFSNYEIASTVFIKKDNEWKAVQTMIAPAHEPD